MRVALCLSGQPRDLQAGIKSIKENIISCNPSFSIDVFCHYWFDERLIGHPFDSAQSLQDKKLGVWDRDTIDIIESLNPKDSYYETPRDFKEYEDFTVTADAIQPRLKSLFYSMFMSNLMKSNIESNEHFKYDMVIRARYDLLFFKPICLQDHLNAIKEHIVVSKEFQNIRMGLFNGGLTMTDLFAIGNSENMDVFCSVNNDFENLYYQIISSGGRPLGENYLGQAVRVNGNIGIEMSDSILFNLVRNVNLR